MLAASLTYSQVSQNVLQGRHLDETNLLHIQTALVTFWRVKVVSVWRREEEPGIVYEVQEVIQYRILGNFRC